MKEILVLLVLLIARTIKVCTQPYQASSNGSCLNSTTHYRLDGSDLCCKKCRPGHRQTQECSETTDTVCDQCPAGQYIKGWNYSPNCFSCLKCKATKGLMYGQNCSSATDAKCVCQPGRYCIMDFHNSYCRECNKYTPCRLGYGVSVPGTADSDVKCEKCPSGTFSDTVSPTERCLPHTNCDGRAVVKEGDSNSDTVCEAPSSSTPPQTSTKVRHAETVMTTASTGFAARGLAGSTPSTSHLPSVSGTASTKSPLPSTGPDKQLVAVIVVGVVIGLILFITIILLCLCKRIWKTEPTKYHPKVDANGNCESGDQVNQGYLVETQMTHRETSPEHQLLLEKVEACSDQSQSSNTTETLTRTDGCSSFESIEQSTLPHQGPHSALSEPRTLLPNTEPVAPQPSVSTQSSYQSSSQPHSQPTSPQMVSPVTTSPHVNVNITVNIGNGSAGTPSVLPADLMQVDSKLRFGEEEETFSIPQQEDGKQSLMSVQESESSKV